MTNYRECSHEGQLINQCADCIRKGFDAEFNSRIELDNDDCTIIRICIDAFCARNGDSQYGSEFASQNQDLMFIIVNRFKNNYEMIVEFIEILLFG